MKSVTEYGAPSAQFDEPFVDKMMRAMAMSWHKYGNMRDAASHGVDLVECLKQRLAIYEETGNSEALIDVANFAMIEFVAPSKEGAFYEPQDSDSSPGIAVRPKTNVMGAQVQQRNHHGKHEELDV